jgi:hypothetical protein
MSVSSSELGPPYPLSRKRVRPSGPPPHGTKGWGAHSPAGEGVRGVTNRTTGEKTLCIFCAMRIV